MKTCLSIAILLCLSIYSFAQVKIPDGYKLKKIITASELAVSTPSDIVFNKSLTHMVISYSNKPTDLLVFETENFEKVNHIRVSGAVYLASSFMDCDNNELLYADYGNSSSKYYTINILSDYIDKTKKRDVPTEECGHSFDGRSELREQLFRVEDKFVLVLNTQKRSVQVFVKDTKRT